MEFIEYPKCLVKGGEWDKDPVTVEDKKAEAAARKKGYKQFGEGIEAGDAAVEQGAAGTAEQSIEG